MARYEDAYGRLVPTELCQAPPYHPAEDYHQQYLAKNPQGYCGIGPTGIVCHLPESAKNST
jgi:peptide-methionine (S)-S-oxide reductase